MTKAILLFLALAACSKTTGTGVVGGQIDDVRALSPKVKFPADGALKQNSLDFDEHGAKMKLNWWTYDAPDGGKYIARYGFEVIQDQKGVVIHGPGHLNPTNSGTEEVPVMRLPVQLAYEAGSTAGTESFIISGDGTGTHDK